MKLTATSVAELKDVHPDLIKVVNRAAEITPLSFVITEGSRTVAQQKINVANGASKTMKSRHIPSSNKCNMACAVDLAAIVGGRVRWDWPLYHILADTMKKAAKDVGVPIEWGGDWTGKFKDGPHFQLPWKTYP